MRRIVPSLLVCFGLAAAACAWPAAEKSSTPPRLVVVLVVDQMRADYLERYEHLFSSGFARILEEGAVFTAAEHDHSATVTATGHATIATGVIPARHGIVANDFFDRREGRTVYSAFDPSASILGLPDASGLSPIRLRREGLADWLRAASPESRVFSMALKDRAAIMLGGQGPDGAYWYDSSGDIVTSDYYRSDYPDWVRDFAARSRVASYFSQGWRRALSPEAYRPDPRRVAPRMPHDFARLFPGGRPEAPGTWFFERFGETPFADEVTLQLAATAVEQEGLGVDKATDLLLIGASAGDFIGHRWGPYSEEIQDYYVRLDRYLGVLFDHFDRSVGADGWTLVLTADHGVAPPPEEVENETARRISDAEFSGAIDAAIREALDEAGLSPAPTVHWQNGPHVVSETATASELRSLRRAIADRFEAIDFIDEAYTAEEIAATGPRRGDMIGRFRRSFDPDRSPDVLYRLKPNHSVGRTTAAHGSPYPYDRRVPLVFMGPGIEPARYAAPVRSIDIAPTLAAIIGVDMPRDLDGRVIRQLGH